jgi:hypothetical protein
MHRRLVAESAAQAVSSTILWLDFAMAEHASEYLWMMM